MRDNPYEAPEAETIPNAPSGKMSFHNAATVFGCGLAGGILGLAIGTFIGSVFPGYYHTVFRVPVEPLEVGAGLGLIQGTTGGFVVGLILVVVHSLYRLWWTREFVKHHSGRRTEDV